jgi:alpha-ribazole phosphatase
MRLDLIRHGDTGRAGYLDGRTDSPLTEEGWRQIERQTAGRRWPLVVASPLARSRLPAIALAERIGARFLVDPDWAELDLGQWDGHERRAIEAEAAGRDRLAAFYSDPVAHAPPNGESWTCLQDRITRAIERLMVEAGDEAAVVITHAGPIRTALSLCAGIPLPSLWAIRLGFGARLTLEVARDNGKLWAELVELAQS